MAGNLRSARCSHEKICHCRARKNKRTARMFANARKDHSIPLKENSGKNPSPRWDLNPRRPSVILSDALTTELLETLR